MEGPQTSTDAPQISFKKRSAKAKSNVRKRPATPPPASDSDDSGFTSSEDESGHRVKRRRTRGGVTATSSSTNRTLQPQETEAESTSVIGAPTVLKPRDDATRTSHWHDVDAATAKELLGNSRANRSGTQTEPDGTYKGNANYTSFIQKNPDRMTNRTVGPVKGSSNVRTITVTDFAPDVCKDWKKSGHCGFGDSCKYLHAREDYKHGWELDQEWEKAGKKNAGGTVVASADRSKGADNTKDETDEALLEKIPFACIICEGSYKNPIVTKCGHYFCESCALKRYRKKPDCAACGQGTGGVFNVAKKLKVLLERKKERVEKKKEAARERGEEVKSD